MGEAKRRGTFEERKAAAVARDAAARAHIEKLLAQYREKDEGSKDNQEEGDTRLQDSQASDSQAT
jgi:hypothetical protein